MKTALKVLTGILLVVSSTFVASEARAETQYFGNAYCRIKVVTYGGTLSGQAYARTDVQDQNNGCSTINAAVKYKKGGVIKTTYGFATNSSAVSAIEYWVASHEQGRGYWYDPNLGVGGWSAWFG